MSTLIPLTRPVHENIVRWVRGRVQVRVWIDCTDHPVPPSAHVAILHRVLTDTTGLTAADEARATCETLAQRLRDAPHHLSVNAVEITIDGNGSLYYPEWP